MVALWRSAKSPDFWLFWARHYVLYVVVVVADDVVVIVVAGGDVRY